MSLPSVTGLDHYIIRVEDLPAAAEQYRKLGFTPALPGQHHTGTRNQTYILDANYIELLYFPQALRAQSRFKAYPDSYQGPVAVALQTTDSAAVHRELAEVGIDADAPIPGGRPVHLPDGAQDAAWLNTVFPDGSLGAPDFFTCGHLTRHLVYRPEWQQHENTARRLEALIVVHPDPASLRDGYERVLGPISLGERLQEGWTLRRGSLRIQFITPDAFTARFPGVIIPTGLPAPWFAGSIIGVRDQQQTRAVLTRNGVPAQDNERGELFVAPDHAAGTLQVFVQEPQS